MKRFAVLAFAALAGCNPRYQMTDQSKDAMVEHAHCLKRQAAILDDGKSDVSGIGIAVDAACAAEKNAVLDAMSAGQGFDFRRRLQAKMDANNWRIATEAVALHRAGR